MKENTWLHVLTSLLEPFEAWRDSLQHLLMLSTSMKELEAILVVSYSRKSFWELCYWSRRRRLVIITGSPLVACLVHQSRNSNVGYTKCTEPTFQFSPLCGQMEKFIVVVKFKRGNRGIVRQGCHKSTWITIKCCSKTNQLHRPMVASNRCI